MESKEDPAFIERASNITNQPEDILEATNASVVQANPNVLNEIDTVPFLSIEPFKTGSKNSENEETNDDKDTEEKVKPEPNSICEDIWNKKLEPLEILLNLTSIKCTEDLVVIQSKFINAMHDRDHEYYVE